MDKYKKIIVIVVVLMMVFAIIGSTFAYLNWQSNASQKTNITFTVTADFACSADGGGDINSANGTLAPADCDNSKYAIKRMVNVSPNITGTKNIEMDLWLNIVSMDTGLRNSDNFKYVLTKNSETCADPIASGTFAGKANGSKVSLLTNKNYSQTTNDPYYLYIWLDKAETSNSTQNQNFHFTFGGMCTSTSTPAPSAPVLDAGLIPVKIADNGTVKAISENDSSWYDYNNKRWANAVLTTSTNRSTYKAIATGSSTTIPSSEILAYYVWIPRYKYAIPTGSGVRTIDIIFENTDTTKSTGNGTDTSYRTHPAFTFDGSEVEGIWVGKFETTGNGTTPTVLPNQPSLVSQNISTQFATAQKFGTSTYGLSSGVDAHMMKNSEWGAAAYLSHSKYGINDEVRINNYLKNNKTLTGCGASYNQISATVETCAIAYANGITYPQSTTGNISGIFDMSGGAWERVMGHYGTNVTAEENSGFTILPAQKYYDVYTFAAADSCTPETCGGHALNETSGWYNDYAYFINSSTNTWFFRGGRYALGQSAGVFGFNGTSGVANGSGSFRSVLLPIGA